MKLFPSNLWGSFRPVRLLIPVMAVLSPGSPADAAPLALQDVITIFNQRDAAALDRISDPTSRIEIFDANDALGPPEILDYAEFRDRFGHCRASSFEDELFLSCPTQPPGADSFRWRRSSSG